MVCAADRKLANLGKGKNQSGNNADILRLSPFAERYY
jgi:hypothetical protein